MCGIAGLYALQGPLAMSPAVIDAMCRSIAHRGPDDQGVHCEVTGHIGMRRLSIIDLSTGHQPIHNEDRTIWLVFNGEIYNFRELRRELEALGHRFYTNTDTECIVHAYEAFGLECFSRLRGMFAVALLDLRAGRLVLARDRLGKKPLYYTTLANGTFAFASELKSLFEVPGFAPRTSSQATHDYFALGYVPAPASIFEGVSKLPPAHVLVANRQGVAVTRYWAPSFGPKLRGSEAELQRQLLEHLEESVRIRLVSDVPFGAFLSGGLDSSIVTALMARNMSQPVKTFSIGFREQAFNELPAARAVAQHVGAEHHEFVVDADAISLLENLAWHFDEPFGDSSAIPTFIVSKLASSHVKMVLTGDGGDELFAGYERYRKFRRLQDVHKASLTLGGPLLRMAGACLPGARGSRLTRIGTRMADAYPDNYLAGVALANRDDLQLILSPDAMRGDPYASVRHHFVGGSFDEPFERILAGDIATYLADDILVKVDRMTMANSLEARAPLLDHELLDFAGRLPFEMKLRGSVGKYLLRKVASELLPAEVLNKPKQGFAIPIARWLRHELRELMSDTFSSRSFMQRGEFNVQGVRRCMALHLSGMRDYSELLWLLLSYETWAQRFIDRGGRRAWPAEATRLRA
jgi:asparagine synthase (glutamine-hydrolysing)